MSHLVSLYWVACVQVLAESIDWCSLDCASGSGKIEKNTMCVYNHQTSTQNCKNIRNSLNQDKRTEILHLHNAYRNEMAAGQKGWPAAANMQQLSWDETLELMALRWAEQCKPGHDQCRRTPEFQITGQNYGMLANTVIYPEGIRKSFEGWVSGKSKANSTIVTNYQREDSWGGFTQVIWADTVKLGCAQVQFSEREVGIDWKRTVTVCNYGPAGNMVTGQIYQDGLPCTKCSTGTDCRALSPYPNLCSMADYITDEPHEHPDVLARTSDGSRIAVIKPKQCLPFILIFFTLLAME